MIKTRIAPSPTWNFHLWTARSALYNFLYARKNWWKFLLRMEDTDIQRCTKESEEDIIQWLKWLWIDYDIWPYKEDDKWPYYQSQRQEIYKEYIEKLLQQWHAYYAWETTEELDQIRQECKEQKKPFVYRQINYTEQQIEKFKKEWRKPVIRFKVSPQKISYNDLIKWQINFDMSEFSDFVIVKSDWNPTFYLVNVIDDYLMWITHILRWEDHIPNTPKQILIYNALQTQHPEFGHLPMLLNSNKSKMSKRDTENETVTISKFKENWFLPEPLINFIALLGWHTSSDEEIFTIKELIEKFSIDRIQVSNAIYDYGRALWFNSNFIKNMKDEDFVDSLQKYLAEFWDSEWQEILKNSSYSYWLSFSPYIKIRIQTLKQFADNAKYFFKQQTPSDEIIFNPKMKVDVQIVKDIIPKIYELLESIDESEWTEEKIKQTLIEFAEKNNYKNWQVLWPIRSILTWVAASPGAFEMLYLLWKKESLQRIKNYKLKNV